MVGSRKLLVGVWLACLATMHGVLPGLFQPLVPPKPPEHVDPSLSPIDRFVRARLHEKGLTPVDRAPPLVLLRRAYFDLHGLPPTPEQVDEYLSDTSRMLGHGSSNAYDGTLLVFAGMAVDSSRSP